jgi:hypothetical protein
MDLKLSSLPVLKGNPAETYPTRRRAKLTAIVILCAVLGVSEVVLLLRFPVALMLLSRYYIATPYLPVYLLLFLLSIYVILLLHECGHAISAYLTRCQILVYSAGPLRIQRTRQGLRVHLNKGRRFFQGWLSSLPLDSNHLRRRRLLIAAGGPLADAFQAGVYFACSFLPGIASGPCGFLRLLAGVALLDCLGNCVPHRVSSRVLSDGGHMLLLIRGGPPLEREMAITLLRMSVAEGNGPLEWPKTLIDKATALPDGTPEDVQGCTFAYYRALAEADIAQAQALLERMLAARKNISADARSRLAAEAAYFEARYHQNSKAALVWGEQAKNPRPGRCPLLRAAAAVLIVEQKPDKARLCIQRAQKAAEHLLFPGEERREKLLLADLLTELAKQEGQ